MSEDHLKGMPELYPTLKEGEWFTMEITRPMTRLDKVLWRLFRYERKRETITQNYVMLGSGYSDGIKAPPETP